MKMADEASKNLTLIDDVQKRKATWKDAIKKMLARAGRLGAKLRCVVKTCL